MGGNALKVVSFLEFHQKQILQLLWPVIKATNVLLMGKEDLGSEIRPTPNL